MRKHMLSGFTAMAVGFSLTAGAAVDEGLVLHYTFDSPAAEIVEDASGNGNYGTMLGTSFEPSGRIGGAFAFNGTESIEVVNPYVIEPWVNPQYSVSVWFLAESPVNFSEMRHIISDNRRYEIATGENADGQYIFTYADSFADCCFGDPVVSTPGAIPLDTWQHAVLTVDGVAPQSVNLYLNGELVATSAGSGANFGGYGLRIGAGFDYFSFSPSSYWIGLIDDVRIYNRVLTTEEIFELANPVNDDDDGGGDDDNGGGDDNNGVAGSVLNLSLSTSEDGSGDVSDITTSDTLFIRLVDAGLDADDPNVNVNASVKKTTGKPKGNASESKFDLVAQTDGSFLGSISMAGFNPGDVKIDIKANDGSSEKRRITTFVTVQ